MMRSTLPIVLLLHCLNNFALSDEVSDIVHEKTQFIIKALKDKALDNLIDFFPKEEVNIAGEIWMPINEFKKFLRDIQGNTEYSFASTEIYNFENCVNSDSVAKFLIQVYRVFDSNSLLSITPCTTRYANKDVETFLGLVFQLYNNEWKVASLFGLDIKISTILKEPFENNDNWKTVDLVNHGIRFPILKTFQEKRYEGYQQVDFILPGSTIRDAVFNISSGQIDFSNAPDHINNPLYFFSNYIFNSVTQKYRYFNKVGKFFPNGFYFEYELIDEGGEKNKGITLVLRKAKTNQMVHIQFFSYYDIYLKYWKDVDTTLRNIQFID